MLTLHEPSVRLNGPGRLSMDGLGPRPCSYKMSQLTLGLGPRSSSPNEDDKTRQSSEHDLFTHYMAFQRPASLPSFWGLFIAEATLRSPKQNGTPQLHGKSCCMRRGLISRPKWNMLLYPQPRTTDTTPKESEAPRLHYVHSTHTRFPMIFDENYEEKNTIDGLWAFG